MFHYLFASLFSYICLLFLLFYLFFSFRSLLCLFPCLVLWLATCLLPYRLTSFASFPIYIFLASSPACALLYLPSLPSPIRLLARSSSTQKADGGSESKSTCPALNQTRKKVPGVRQPRQHLNHKQTKKKTKKKKKTQGGLSLGIGSCKGGREGGRRV